jgi:hypothetical protein
LGVGLGRQRPPASGTAEAGGGRCWSLGSGEPRVRPGQREGGEATGGPSGSTSSAGWRLRDRRVELRVTTHGSGGGSARAPCVRGECGRLLKANKGGGAALRAKTMVAVWGAAWQGTATTWGGMVETPMAGGGKVGAHGHGARDAWRKRSGGKRRCGARGPTARGPADRGRPQCAGPARPRRRQARDAGVARDAARAWAQSAPIEFRLAMFDCQKLKFSKHKWTK